VGDGKGGPAALPPPIYLKVSKIGYTKFLMESCNFAFYIISN
jgi:hypothetical protein